MIYLSGSTNEVIEDRLIAAGVGLINGFNCRYAPDRVRRFPSHAIDNGCFSARWEELPWLRWLEVQPVERCLFAVSPDVYPDATESLRRGLSFAPIIRSMGFPVAVVAQDGAELLDWPWDEIDCLFVGGKRQVPRSLEWKVSPQAERLIRAARAAGKWVHMGRVNSLKAMEKARRMGCQSADGTFIGKGPNTNLPRAQHWFDWLAMHPPLPLERLETPSHPTHRELVDA